VVFESAGGVIGEGVGFAGGEVAAGRASLAIGFGDGVGGAVAVGPGDGSAFFDGDIGRTEREVLNGYTVSGGRIEVVTVL